MYTCEICRKNFTLPNNLSRHLNKHNQIKFTCTVCRKNFTRSDTLKNHILLKHNNQSTADHNETDYGKSLPDVSYKRSLDVRRAYSLQSTGYLDEVYTNLEIDAVVDELRLLYRKKFTEYSSERIQYLVEHLQRAGVIY